MLVAANEAPGQTLTFVCGGSVGRDCRGQVADADALQSATILLTVTQNGSPLKDADLRVSASAGTLLESAPKTDGNGVARISWLRSKGSDTVGIVARVVSRGEVVIQEIRLEPHVTDRTRANLLTIHPVRGYNQSWFEKSQLPRRLKVELLDSTQSGFSRAITERTRCTASRVLFRARGAPSSVSPDTAAGFLIEGNIDGRLVQRCFAETYWALGEGIGDRKMEIVPLPAKGTVAGETKYADAWARTMPKFVAGFAYVRLRAYNALNPAATRTLRIETTHPNGTKTSFDTLVETSASVVKHVDKRGDFSAVAAFNLPIPIARLNDWDGLSFTAGFDLARPTERMFLGGSLIKLLGGLVPVIEVMPFDFHATAFFARQDEIRDPRCQPTECETRKRFRYQSIAFMFSADASLVTDIAKNIKP